jgi:hypothetical protein
MSCFLSVFLESLLFLPERVEHQETVCDEYSHLKNLKEYKKRGQGILQQLIQKYTRRPFGVLPDLGLFSSTGDLSGFLEYWHMDLRNSTVL